MTPCPQCQWVKFDFFSKEPFALLRTYPAGTSWTHLKSAHQFAPKIPSGYGVNTFEKYPPLCSENTQWVKCEYFVKEPSALLQTYPLGIFGAKRWVL